MSSIHWCCREGAHADDVPQPVVQTVTDWLAKHEEVDGVVWTGLPSNWKEKRGEEFKVEDAVAYLLELRAESDRAKATYDRAREYLTNTPSVVSTDVRDAMRAYGWDDATLSSSLFDPPPADSHH